MFNERQTEAINFEHEKPAIITAAAGSGKTALLVERVVRLLLGNPDRPDAPTLKADSIVVMTFTKKATKNLRDRLNNSLRKELEKSVGNTERHDFISEQILLLRQAYISTIDAFCLRLIRENPEEFDLPLNFTTLSTAKKITLQLRSLDHALKVFYDMNPQTRVFSDDERDALFYTFNFENDKELQRKLMSLEDTLSAYKDAGEWLDNTDVVYENEQSYERCYIGAVVSQFKKLLIKARDALSEYDQLLERDLEAEASELFKSTVPGKTEDTRNKNLVKKINDFKLHALEPMKKYIENDKKRFDILFERFKSFSASPSLTSFSQMLKEFTDCAKISIPKLTKKPKDLDLKQFDKPSKALKKIADNILGSYSYTDQRSAFYNQRTAVKAFTKLLRIYHNHYKDIKFTSGNLDFSDCELLLMKKLISDSVFREQIAGRFQCVIVDEFQDSNDVQAEIFERIGGGHLFYVGDIKQSIYAFRGGNPKIMSKLCEPASGFKVIPLTKNYRSREEVLNTVNYAFSDLMTKEYGGVDYALPENKLECGADFPKSQPPYSYSSEICFVSADEGAEPEMIQPRAVAKRIRELIDNENFFVTKENSEGKKIFVRPCFSDFAILMRTKKNAPLYRRALAELGISSTAPGGDAFLDNEEIKLILDYLIIVDNPQRNEETLNILMSPIYRLDAEEMSLMRLGLLGIDLSLISEKDKKSIITQFRGYSLYSCARRCCEDTLVIKNDDGDTASELPRRVSSKLRTFIDDITRFRYFMCTNSIYRLVCRICEDTDLLSTAAAFSDSSQRIANIRQFQDMTAEFESHDGGSLSDFLRYIEYTKSLEKYKIDDAQLPEGSNSVSIMTSHKSKGLEFPVCIICELEDTISNLDTASSILIDRGTYLASRSVDHKKRVKTENPSYSAVRDAIKLNQRGDELRLLYVAMTRAQDKLIMFTQAKAENWISDVYDPQNPSLTFEGSIPFKWIFSSLMRYYDPQRGNFAPETCCKLTETTTGCKPESLQTAKTFTDISDSEVQRLAQKIDFSYKYKDDTNRRAKYTATELAHMSSTYEVYCESPNFVKNGKLTGAEIGTAYHTCMQFIPISELKSAPNTEAYTDIITRFINETDVISQEEKAAVKTEKIVGFLNDELGQRMLRSAQIFREDEFLVKIDGSMIGLSEPGEVKIQGIVDLYFIENDEIVIVDYKTDTVENFKIERENYEHQVNIYSTALHKKKKLPVKEIYLYTFSSSEAYQIK